MGPEIAVLTRGPENGGNILLRPPCHPTFLASPDFQATIWKRNTIARPVVKDAFVRMLITAHSHILVTTNASEDHRNATWFSSPKASSANSSSEEGNNICGNIVVMQCNYIETQSHLPIVKCPAASPADAQRGECEQITRDQQCNAG